MRAFRLACWFGLLWALAAPCAWAGRAIALVYDDSGSMAGQQSWVSANYSVQVLTAMASESDRLWLVRMSDPPGQPASEFSGPQGIEALLQAFRQQQRPASGTGTPYHSVRKAIDALAGAKADEKWLLVLTDGGFEGVDQTAAHGDIAFADGQQHIHTVFLLIQQQNHELAQWWVGEGHGQRLDAASASEILDRMEQAADLLNARSFAADGLAVKTEGNDWRVSSRFPLRRLIVLNQDGKAGQLLEARSPQGSLHIRQHEVVAREKNKGLPQAHIVHITGDDPIAAGEGGIRLRFDRPSGLVRVKLLPEVAARFDMRLAGPDGAALKPDAAGVVTVCAGDVARLELRIVDDEGQPVTPGRDDIDRFNVGFTLGSKTGRASLRLPGQDAFTANLAPDREVELRGFAVYPGYFHFQSEPLRLRPVSCSRAVRLELGGLDASGEWRAEVDRVGQAPFVEITATVDGQPVSPEEFARWTLSSKDEGWLDWQRQADRWRVRPKAACCVRVWARPAVGERQISFTLDTQNRRDQITPPKPVRFVLLAPADTLRALWWWACPVAALLISAFLLWYAWRLLVKQRFAPKACVWRQDGATKVFNAIPLRKRAGWLARWFWPSAREKANIDGLLLYAQGKGASVLLAGSSLGERHEIDGWLFDEALKAKGKPQRDVRLNDKAEIIVRDPATRQRGAFAKRYKYSRDKADPGWR